ncbi:MAG: hypothetical protein MZV63_47590 [Marinilabiliales bacterium]|nr:hypothetical protein [Marinilabiliales bacterium]
MLIHVFASERSGLTRTVVTEIIFPGASSPPMMQYYLCKLLLHQSCNFLLPC